MNERYLRALAENFTKIENENVLAATIEHIIEKTSQRKLAAKYGVAQSTIGKYKKSLLEQHQKFECVKKCSDDS
ncbi:helix-turn-helix domain-containing protein [Vibrio vulnificus]|uniref:helix-turn-helix domain-containing protein n=1 Tax=Vibrio vulnificus TaxID=672 RepID=UPI00405923AE